MPSKKQYDLVQNDDYDTRIPLHPEEAFHHGITFQAKYIGMLDVPRPTSRVEIVAAMRRIRYEFKAKGIKKKKVTIEVSVDGVKVTLRKKKKKKHWLDEKPVLLFHPIYRIFYVSHDSQDLKIFSYIARDGASNVFKCAVFKSNKKSQAMRVVRTVGQAFEVCHKLSINAPENEQKDHDDETLTQDLLSDRLSDITCDKPKKDLLSDSDKLSLPDESTFKELNCTENSKASRGIHLDVLPPPPTNNFSSRSPLISGETYASPQSDGLISAGSGSCGSSSLPAAGSALSAHHELQLLREQLDQQSQQTQAAIAQLQLTREQLAAEQTARLEAQARTHQLLVHNRELLDHIAALVAHLQGGDKVPSQAQTSPHVTMPQQQPSQGFGDGVFVGDHSDPASLDHSSVLQALGLNPQGLIENRAVTSCLPASPIRTTYNPSGTVFNFSYPPVDTSFESQLLQRLQSLSGYSPPHLQYNYNQSLPYLQPNIYPQPLVNNNYTLQPPPQKKLPPSPLAVRHSYSGSPVLDKRVSPARTTDLQNVNFQQPNTPNQSFQSNSQNFHKSNQNLHQTNQNFQSSNQNLQQPNQNLQQPNQNFQQPNQNYHQSNQNFQQANQNFQPTQQSFQKGNQNFQQQQQSNQNYNQAGGCRQNLNLQNHLQLQSNSRQSPQTSPQNERKEAQFIKPISQMGTLTTTDIDGRLRVIVPVPANADDAGSLLASLRLGEDLRPANVPSITRSTSEKVPNRSELMSQVQRTAWARHTTK